MIVASSSTALPFAYAPGKCPRCGIKNHAGLCPPSQGRRGARKRCRDSRLRVGVDAPVRGAVVGGLKKKQKGGKKV